MKISDADAPVSQALIMICEKCGKKLASREDDNPSRALQSALKEEIKSIGAKGQLRAVVTSCMDICPDREIAVGISWSKEAGGEDRFVTIKEGDLNTVRDAILHLAQSKKP